MAFETLLHLSPPVQLCLAVAFLNGALPFVTVRSACRREWSWTVPASLVGVGIAAVGLPLPDADGVTALLRLCLAGSIAATATIAGMRDA